MAHIDIYLPDDLVTEAKAHGLNLSGLTQDALRSAIAASRVDECLDDVAAMRSLGIADVDVAAAMEEARDEVDGPR